MTIDWQNQTADQIEALVNASNPVYGGAITYFRNAIVRVLEVSPATMADATILRPGSIVHASQIEGLFVLCSDYKFLKINIIRSQEAILSGNKLAALGIRQDEKFGLQNQNPSIKKSKIII
ncbi:hypothetical protein R9C00_04965 [Flammeovirgaceae bacterium SG7u.111]|nr:hypothetical protein [Flammeovirgaceae bacterium SG7u.132]WPO36795.1 hypothetical protein R9C00_04965 [Flammeovirgaceae bacterium SG7u.111]